MWELIIHLYLTDPSIPPCPLGIAEIGTQCDYPSPIVEGFDLPIATYATEAECWREWDRWQFNDSPFSPRYTLSAIPNLPSRPPHLEWGSISPSCSPTPAIS